METLKLDISKTGVAVSAAMQAKAQAANALLESGKGAGSDFLGWVHLPSSITPDRIEAIEKQAAKLPPRRPKWSSASASAARIWAPRPCSKP